MKKATLIIKYFIGISLTVMLIGAFSSCNNNNNEIFHLEGTYWTASWNESENIVDCSLTFGDKFCIIEIYDNNGEAAPVFLNYLYHNKTLIVNIAPERMDIIDIYTNSFTWNNFPFTEPPFGYNVTFHRKNTN
ncbi:MAG: hypothetical protein LBV69_05435 [Bacteroidales bacterium]|jgi:hypothetical protein|nr:hypothetical protein [Bacteroidales bacterium]